MSNREDAVSVEGGVERRIKTGMRKNGVQTMMMKDPTSNRVCAPGDEPDAAEYGDAERGSEMITRGKLAPGSWAANRRGTRVRDDGALGDR